MNPRRIITRKRLIRLTRSLILGAVVSIIIALSCTLWLPKEWSYRGPIVLERDLKWWQDHTDDKFPPIPSGCSQELGFGKESVFLYHEESITGMRFPQNAGVWYAGWPWYAFRGGATADRVRRRVVNFDVVLVPAWVPWKQQVWLPTEILWPGLLCDTAVYGTAIYLLCSGAGMARRRLRLKRGTCPECAYVLGSDSLRCPECGWTRGGMTSA